MKSVEDILVPIDFSSESILGLEAAVEIAKKFDCRINLAHFILPSAEIAPQQPEKDIFGITETIHLKQPKAVKQEMYDKLKSLMAEFAPKVCQGQVWIITCNIDNIFEEFTDHSSVDVDLIITGTSGDQNLLEFFTGNHTDKMIRQTEIPILVITTDEKLDLKNVLLATDLSNTHPEKVQQFCRSLQKSGSNIHLGHVITTPIMTKTVIHGRMKELADSYGLLPCNIHIEEDTNILSGLQKIIQHANADILLMKTYQKSPISSWLVGSLAEQAIKDTDIPVVVERVSRK